MAGRTDGQAIAAAATVPLTSAFASCRHQAIGGIAVRDIAVTATATSTRLSYQSRIATVAAGWGCGRPAGATTTATGTGIYTYSPSSTVTARSTVSPRGCASGTPESIYTRPRLAREARRSAIAAALESSSTWGCPNGPAGRCQCQQASHRKA